MKQGSGASPRTRNRTRLVKTAAELNACLNIKTRYDDVTLKHFENFIVFYCIWSYFDRSRTIKKMPKNDQDRSWTIKNDQERSKNKVVNFWGSISIGFCSSTRFKNSINIFNLKIIAILSFNVLFALSSFKVSRNVLYPSYSIYLHLINVLVYFLYLRSYKRFLFYAR